MLKVVLKAQLDFVDFWGRKYQETAILDGEGQLEAFYEPFLCLSSNMLCPFIE